MCRMMGDARRAEAHHVLALAALFLLPVAIHVVAEFVTLPIRRWPLQGAIVLTILLTAAAGWQPRIRVYVADGRLVVRRRRDVWGISLDEIEAAETITFLRYHRHYRRYAVTRSFVGRPEEHVLLLRTPRGPVILGLNDRDRSTLLHHLENQRSVQVV
jgi:hypothetical protein